MRFFLEKIFSRPEDETDATDRKPRRRGATFEKIVSKQNVEKKRKSAFRKKRNNSLVKRDFAQILTVSESR